MADYRFRSFNQTNLTQLCSDLFLQSLRRYSEIIHARIRTGWQLMNSKNSSKETGNRKTMEDVKLTQILQSVFRFFINKMVMKFVGLEGFQSGRSCITFVRMKMDYWRKMWLREFTMEACFRKWRKKRKRRKRWRRRNTCIMTNM